MGELEAEEVVTDGAVEVVVGVLEVVVGVVGVVVGVVEVVVGVLEVVGIVEIGVVVADGVVDGVSIEVCGKTSVYFSYP